MARENGILERAESLWRERPDPLHRLAILRALSARLHTTISRDLAATEGLPDAIARIETLVNRIETLRDHDLSAPDLSALLTSHDLPPRVMRELPASLPFAADLVTRYDRSWERAMVIEAIKSGWTIDVVERVVPADAIESEAARVDESNWPRAILLFTESLGIEGAGDGALWRARWWFARDPGHALSA